MYSDLESRIKTTIYNYSETKNLDQETKDFIFKLVESATREAAKRDVCKIALHMYNEGIDTCNIRNFTGVEEEELLKK